MTISSIARRPPLALRWPLFVVFTMHMIVSAGCSEDMSLPAEPEPELKDITVILTTKHFPALPTRATLFAGTDETPVDHENAEDGVLHTSLSVEAGRPQILALVDGDYDLYGAGIFTGTESVVEVDAASSIEVAMLVSPTLWTDDVYLTQDVLLAMRSHAAYEDVVDQAASSLPSGGMEFAFAEAEPAELAGKIVWDLSDSLWSQPVPEVQKMAHSHGRVTITTEDEERARAFAAYVGGNFWESCTDISNFQIQVLNYLPRHLAMCRRDYPSGATEPLARTRFPGVLLEPASILGPSSTNLAIDFAEGELEKVDLMLLGASGADDDPPVGDGSCAMSESERSKARSHVIGEVVKFAFGVVNLPGSGNLYLELLAFAMNYLEAASLWLEAAYEEDADECVRITKDAMAAYLNTLPIGHPLWKGTKVTSDCIFVWGQGYYLFQLNSAPRWVEYGLEVSHQSNEECEADTLGRWILDWQVQGTREFTYTTQVGLLDSEGHLVLHFGQGDDTPTGIPLGTVQVSDILSADLDSVIDCKMVIYVGEENGGTALAPFNCDPGDGVPASRVYVWFTELEFPEGLFPGRASGYFWGDLEALQSPDPHDPDTWWCEGVSIADVAEFSDVRVFK